ncbi:hypothetical protein AAFF_G00099360 [Aldrovandia affinis]|uniref:Cytoplasmic dynein 2 heavy chain 1-like protein n=1 Tax=Aldrovandia affinis TaxID=143900 RepID=A0AAD7RUW8_9TELE|nr:hypothetical protein AAFF_G00099360 [Aldrovandia affinis]
MPKSNQVKGGVTAATALASHSYCASQGGDASDDGMETLSSKVRRPLPDTPTKIPVPFKKLRGDEEVSNATILAAVNNLSAMLQELNVQMKNNSVMIAEIAKSVEFNAKEIKDCKSKTLTLEKEVTKIGTENANLRERVLELERYKRRWNLKLRGLKEQDNENTRETVSQILVKIAPQWTDKIDSIVDSVHRLGKKENCRHRHIVIHFTMRHFRDELWRLTKGSAVCKELNVSFVEHVLPADREARVAVWPQIKQAREAGQRAYFRGPNGFINGKIIMVP